MIAANDPAMGRNASAALRRALDIGHPMRMHGRRRRYDDGDGDKVGEAHPDRRISPNSCERRRRLPIWAEQRLPLRLDPDFFSFLRCLPEEQIGRYCRARDCDQRREVVGVPRDGPDEQSLQSFPPRHLDGRKSEPADPTQLGNAYRCGVADERVERAGTGIRDLIVVAARDSAEAVAAESRCVEIFSAIAAPSQDRDAFPSCNVVIAQFERLEQHHRQAGLN